MQGGEELLPLGRARLGEPCFGRPGFVHPALAQRSHGWPPACSLQIDALWHCFAAA